MQLKGRALDQQGGALASIPCTATTTGEEQPTAALKQLDSHRRGFKISLNQKMTHGSQLETRQKRKCTTQNHTTQENTGEDLQDLGPSKED